MNVATFALGCLTYLALSGQAATAPQQITQADRDMAVRHLAETRQKFLDSIAGLSQEQVARRIGKPQSYVSKCESGERRVDVVELKAFAKLYGVPLAFFVS